MSPDMNIKPQHRQFSHQKLLILLIVILKFQIEDEPIKYIKHYQNDIKFCSSCFQNQNKHCQELFKQILENYEFRLQTLVGLIRTSGKRETSVLKINSKTKIIAKYLIKGKNLRALSTQLQIKDLSKQFHDEQRLDGMQLCPTKSLNRFIDLFKPLYDDLTIWLYLLFNIQPLLMPYLRAANFSVPATHAVCGFTIFQQYAGISLIHFYSSHFRLKLQIAKQLLEVALQLSLGFEGFRIYVTDLSADNIVYDKEMNRLSFVDLDTVYIVDSLHVQLQRPHKHEYIECSDCFAYSPADICQSQKSDINLFSSCQFLREDLKRDATKGFLYPIPNKYTDLVEKLDECVDCPNSKCVNRFAATVELIEIIEKILQFQQL